MSRGTDCDVNTEDRDVSKELAWWERDLCVMEGDVLENASVISEMVFRIDTLVGISAFKKTTDGAGCSGTDTTSTPAGGEKKEQKRGTPKKKH